MKRRLGLVAVWLCVACTDPADPPAPEAVPDVNVAADLIPNAAMPVPVPSVLEPLAGGATILSAGGSECLTGPGTGYYLSSGHSGHGSSFTACATGVVDTIWIAFRGDVHHHTALYIWEGNTIEGPPAFAQGGITLLPLGRLLTPMALRWGGFPVEAGKQYTFYATVPSPVAWYYTGGNYNETGYFSGRGYSAYYVGHRIHIGPYSDTDDDGVIDPADNCPTVPNADQTDTDGDGEGDACDGDDDGDGVADGDDAFPLDPAEWADNDGDGVGDNGDPDDDNDGVQDADDAFPLDPAEWSDTDGDGTGDNADLDDDNDGQSDVDETACGSDPLDAGSLSPDNDGDASPDCVDPDDDNDGVTDADDAFPFDPAEWSDNDGDGTGDNADLDDDNDGQTDADELACGSDPLNRGSLAPDYDGDSSPDCVDPDDDDDGVPDAWDAFPMSDTSPTVSIGGDDTGVGNQVLPDGSTFSDVIGACAADAVSHGAFVTCVTANAGEWRSSGLISGSDLGRIMGAAAKAHSP